MKILHIALSMSHRCGGPTIAVNDMARFQALSGLNVTVFATNADYPDGLIDVPTKTAQLKNGVLYRYFAVQFKPLLVSLPMAIELKKNLRDFDLVHIHGLYRFPTTLAAFLSRKYNIPYIIEPHGSLDPFIYRQSAVSVLVKRVYEKMFDIPNLNAASAIHFSSVEERERAGFLDLKAPASVVPNGIDWSRFEHLPPRGRIRKHLGLKDQHIILFLGRINFKKGLDLLVQAFSNINEITENAVLVIAGPDNDGYTKFVRKWVNEQGLSTKVYWLGMLYEREVLEAYVDADVFVLPSYTENFGIAVVEAMACGLPVVISDQVNIWNDVQHSEAGRVVGLEHNEISNAIVDILENKELATRMGRAGRELAKTRYDYSLIIEKVTKMYATAMDAL